MSTTHAHDVSTENAALPPLCLAALALAAKNLLEATSNLPPPRGISVSDTQRIELRFEPEETGYESVTRWCLWFDGVLRTTSHQSDEGALFYYTTAEFDFGGIAIVAYIITATDPAA